MKKLLYIAAFAICGALFLAACSSTPRVTRLDADTQVDLSGRWNAADSRLVSQEMIRDCLSHFWIDQFMRQTGEMPRIIVGTVRNLSDEHIDTGTFVSDLERALINSGRVRFVASADQRIEIREERLDQAIHARPDTAAPMGQETGADFMLQGQIRSIRDSINRRQAIFYQTELELTCMRTNERVWIGQKQIQKYISRRRFRG
ncbi:MAG: penicillin-binding protein activator LpoB [Elusimicrobia bacterium]|nr:penicillin-binding protein activator LpoB [Elusimicrobiota bacterium]